MATLQYKIKADLEKEIWRQYIARCVRLVTENTAGIAQGQYIKVEYDDIINPKPEKVLNKGDATKSIRAKLR